MSVSCASAGQSGTEAPAGQEASVEQEAPAEQEEAPAEQEASVDQEAVTAQEAATVQEAVAAQTAATALEETAAAAQTAATEQAASIAQEISPEQEGMYEEAVKSLFGEGGPLFGVLPEGMNIDDVIGTAKEQMGQADQQIRQVVDEVAEKAQNETGDLNQGALKEYAEALLDRFMGPEENDDDSSDSFDFDALDEAISTYQAIRDLETEYIKERNAGLMDVGDVQIVSNDCLEDDDLEGDQTRMLNCVIQNNYRLDEENQLRPVSSSEDVVLFTHQKDQDGNYPVTDALFAEKGDNYSASIEAMYLQMGESSDEWETDIEASRIMVLYDMEQYLEEHPDVKGIEFEGEIRTAEELDEIMISRLNELYGE